MEQQRFDEIFDNLTPSQRKILRLLAQGQKDNEISVSLKIEPATVRTHVKNICRAFGLRNEPGEKYSLRPTLITLCAKYKPNWVSKHTLTNLNNVGVLETPNAEKIRWQTSDSLVDHEAIASSYHDLGEAPDVLIFFGRTEEFVTLKQWIVSERCRLVAILGMRGIGKTSFSVKLVKQIQDDFEYIIWRSLFNAPPITDILTDLIKFLSNQQETDFPNNIDFQISRLLHYLRSHRCLIVLDNVEAILQGGDSAGQCQKGYEDYGKLFRQVGKIYHNSCLLLTSREKPKEIALLEGKTRPIRSLLLKGLNELEGQKIFTEIDCFASSDDEWKEIINFYDGNPLILEIVAKHIYDVFRGNIAGFISLGKQVFSDIYELLDWHFERLSCLEKQVFYWLAINRELVSVFQLQDDLLSSIAKEKVTETIQSLQRRLPIIRSIKGFALQPVLVEYTYRKLIKQISQEIVTGEIELLNSHALLKATAKDNVREAQVRLIIKPIKDKLLNIFKNQSYVEDALIQISDKSRQKNPLEPGYIGGNILNILCQIKTDLKGYNFSFMTIWQAYLQGVNLHDVNFAYSEFAHSIFTQTIGSILSVKFSPDGKLLATGDATGEISLWQIADDQGYKISTCQGHTNWIWSVAFCLDDNILASGSSDQTVKLWDIKNGQCLKTFKGHNNRVRSVAFSPKDKIMVSGSEDKTVKIWDVNTGQCLNTLQQQSRVWSVTFNPTGQILAISCEDHTVKLWDVKTGQYFKSLKGHKDWVNTVVFSPDGKIIATSSHDQTVKIWDVQNGQCLNTFIGHTNEVTSVIFSPNSQTLATGGADKTVKLWQIQNGRCLKTLNKHTSCVRSVTFSPDGQRLASGGEDRTVKIWDVNTGQCLNTLQGYINWNWSVVFSPDGKIMVSGSEDYQLRLWEVKTGQCLNTLPGHTSCVWSVACSPDNHIIASGSADRTVKLWDIRTGRCIKTLVGHAGWIFSVAFSADGQTLASGSEDQTVKLWDVRTGQCIKTLVGHVGWVRPVAFSADGQTLASGSEDQTVRLWDVRTGQCLNILQEHTSRIRSVTFSSDKHILVSGSDDYTLKVWDLRTGQCLNTLSGHTNWVQSVAFCPDNQILASGSNDNTIKLWSIQSGRCLNTWLEHADAVLSVAFSPTGKLLGSGSQDGTIKIFDINRGECIKTLRSERPYERMNITGIKGLTESQKATLLSLGAINEELELPI
ncbi:MAG: LuxR C-terminal-related transcriptional regulator [Coleofasciculus sp. B1-GNL1-01]|uniref:WD40 domain-containing protein n=1 Tax=Coleofasciculus sp. B1-GNL1-01 TaxID=3068484 RepID=UPI00330390CC